MGAPDDATPAARVATGVATVVGAGLGLLSAAVRALGRRRPLHPVGRALHGTLRWGPGAAVAGLGVPGHELAVVARRSRSVGLPAPLPDVDGLALRWGPADAPHDVLLASTGTGPLSRFVLTLRRPGVEGTLGSLMPYRSRLGPLVLFAAPEGAPGRWTLRAAVGTQPLHDVGALTLDEESHDTPRRLDPVLHPPAGVTTYGWAAAVRLRPYRAARGGRPL
ncbi:hypothetical protein [Cellulomonas marina]|uniref:Phosphodiesterase n=1 Tax=Cellulomonas marina TaxID=988821 RepID=A0A1I0Z0G3_9CELL|nr:hypothetical protein [Cellulomonas marina]GIG28156.1 hypothetical protein Cma02nite_07560 [Cellulomonas marina]SFB19115.1 hypothetical protein SAMN05421867_10996 [Cellulomonas marina]